MPLSIHSRLMRRQHYIVSVKGMPISWKEYCPSCEIWTCVCLCWGFTAQSTQWDHVKPYREGTAPLVGSEPMTTRSILWTYSYLYVHMFPVPSPVLAAIHVCNHFCHGEIYNSLKNITACIKQMTTAIGRLVYHVQIWKHRPAASAKSQRIWAALLGLMDIPGNFATFFPREQILADGSVPRYLNHLKNWGYS